MRALALSLTVCAALAACAGTKAPTAPSPAASVPTIAQSPSTSASPASAPSPEASADGDAAAQTFAEALQNYGDPDLMREALDVAAPGSVAHTYASHLANTAEAALDGGEPMSDTITEKMSDGTFRSFDDPKDEDTCATFTNFVTNASGKLTDLTVNGKKVSERITTGNGQAVTAAGAQFTFLTAYKSSSLGHSSSP